MNKIELSQEELDTMNYNDIAYLILQNTNKKMKLIDLFKEVGIVLDMSEDDQQNHIMDFFELISTDKRFVTLDNGFWDLSIKHSTGMIIEDDEDEDEELLPEEDNNEYEEEYYEDNENKNSDDDIEEDDLSDLVIIDDSDEENNL